MLVESVILRKVEIMETEKLKACAPFLLMDGALVLAMIMLLQLDWIVNNTFYDYNLSFSLNWATPYWTVFRAGLLLIGLTITASTITGYYSYRKAGKESEKVVFLCRHCGNAWTKLYRSVKTKGKLPKFKILISCPSCNEELLDEQAAMGQADIVEAHVENQVLAEALESNKE